VLVTALYNASRGSILLAALLHFQLMNPIWPDAQPYDTYLLSVLAIAVVWYYKKQMFSMNGDITKVLPEASTQALSQYGRAAKRLPQQPLKRRRD
jgi:hypothetical protein